MMDNEYKFQLVIVPESYDYVDEEIVYRIYLNKQLISERSLPILKENQHLLDTFFIKSNSEFLNFKLVIINCKSKKCFLEKFFINEKQFSKNTLICNIKNITVRL